MRLAWKLSLALLPAVALVLLTSGYIRVQRELALFDEDMRRDQHIVATTLAHTIAAVHAAYGEHAAQEVISQVDASRSHLRIRWLDAPPQPIPAAITTSSKRSEAPVSSYQSDGRLVTYAKVPYPSGQLPTQSKDVIEVSESLAARGSYLSETLRNTFLLTLALGLACTAVTLAIGQRLITRPVQLLIDRARTIDSDGTASPVALAQQDEVGTLARALDETAARLQLARQATETESKARAASEAQLRHAERLATTGRLASALAHEIGTPLNVAGGHAQLLLQSRLSDADVQESAHAIKDQCDRMADLVRQLLDYARRRSPQVFVTNLSDVVGATVDLLRPLASQKKVLLNFVASDPGCANVDAFQCQQALTNVIMNAVQASPEGASVSITLTKLTRSSDSELAAGPCIQVSIEDSGPGIAADDTSQIFEPFYTTKPSGTGTGLGLSITRDIVREHHGWIEVSSSEDGSRFDLYWPAFRGSTGGETTPAHSGVSPR